MAFFTLPVLSFVGLNAVRILSLVSMVLVWVAILVMMIQDGQDFHNANLRAQADEEDCTYIPGTEIPTHVWGVFWAELHRVFLLLAVAVGILSEVSWGKVRARYLPAYMPLLGRDWSVAPLGAFQVAIASSVLSHYMDDFPLAVSWLLFCVGLVNIAVGLCLGQRMKGLRSIFAQRRTQAWKDEPPRNSTKDRQARFTKPKAGDRHKSYGAIINGARGLALLCTSKRKSRSLSSKPQEKLSINDDFPSIETESQRELLRQRAREANARAEHAEAVQETALLIDVNADNDDGGHASQTLSQSFTWDSRHQIFHERADASSTGVRRRDRSAVGAGQTSERCPWTGAASEQVRIGGYAGSQGRAASRTSGRTSSVAGSAAGSSASGGPARRTTRKHVVGSRFVAGGPGNAAGGGLGSVAVQAMKRRSAALARMAKARMSGGVGSVSGAARRNGKTMDDGRTVSIVIDRGQGDEVVPPLPMPAHRPRKVAVDGPEPVPAQHLPIAGRFARGWADEVYRVDER